MKTGILLAFLAAALYAVSSPFSKLLLQTLPPVITAGFLYLGAGAGMLIVAAVRRIRGSGGEAHLTRRSLPFVLGMIVLDIAAPILLMLGLRVSDAATASLLNNFEIVATSLIALLFFREKISPRLWGGILMVTISCVLLTAGQTGTLQIKLEPGALLILGATCCWGLENNCTRMLSAFDPLEIVLLKGIFSGGGSVVIGLCSGERLAADSVRWLPAVLLLGLCSYGLSIFVYIYAQRRLGAARTSSCYAVSPFIGAALSLILLGERPGSIYPFALAVMAVGSWLCSSDEPLFRKKGKEVQHGS